MDVAIEQAVSELPAELQPPVQLWLSRAFEQQLAIPQQHAARIVRAVACSEFAADVMLREGDWFTDHLHTLHLGTIDDELASAAAEIASSDDAEDKIKARLRQIRNRCMLWIFWREVHGMATLDETLQRLSLLADRLLEASTQYASRQMRSRFGRLLDAAGTELSLIILGMGKLGGRELNFSSDIDLIFSYSEGGESEGPRVLSAQEYFGRQARMVIGLLDEKTADGFVFRVDTRLRPFGESGPPVVSFAALESYLLQHGRDWERYAYVKVRVVGLQPPQKALDELYKELIQPFVYRRYLDYGVFESLREMHAMIAAEVQRRDLADNVKLGPGGIRETEFIVQALQLVRGGSEPALQGRQLQQVVPRLVSSSGLSESDAKQLLSAYAFLRRVENFIQAMRDRQTHELPANSDDRARLCLAMNYRNWDAFVADLDKQRDAVSAQFAAIAFRGRNDRDAEHSDFASLWDSNSRANAEQWQQCFAQRCASKPAELAAEVAKFAMSLGSQRVDATAHARLDVFMPALLELVITSKRPLAALSRTLAITGRILRRSAYIALLNENQGALSRLVDLCARSSYIAEQIAQFPVLLDELLDPRSYDDEVRKMDLQAELQQRLQDAADGDVELRMRELAHFQRAALFRIAVADFNGRLPIMKVSDGLTWLAEVVLDETLQMAWSDLSARHGIPRYQRDDVEHTAGFGIIAYGKLGGLELSYGSDLDIVFLHDSVGTRQSTDGPKSLDNSVFYSRLVRRLVHFLTTQTGSGELYEVDTRLRPDGKSGLLVTSTEAFEKYQEEHAWTWEHQALLRARAVAGSDKVCAEFERIRRDTLAKRVNRDTLRDDVIAMRQRMRAELDRSDRAHFDLKHGQGGLGDIEFLVQYLVLQHAQTHAGLLTWSDNIRQLDALIEARVVTSELGLRLQAIYKDYRLHLHHLALDAKSALCDPQRFGAETAEVIAAWDLWLSSAA